MRRITFTWNDLSGGAWTFTQSMGGDDDFIQAAFEVWRDHVASYRGDEPVEGGWFEEPIDSAGPESENGA